MPENKQARREAARAYKEREEIGGLFRVVNTKNGWQSPLQSTPNLEGQLNRFQFAKSTNACIDLSLSSQWAEFGADAFELLVVEQLKKKPEQSTAEFREELKALLEIMQQKG